MKTKEISKWGLFFAIALTFSLGCEKKELKFNDTLNGFAQLTVRMHDTVGPYSEVKVEITGAAVHVEDSNTNGWVNLAVNPGVYDLLELQNGIDTILANATTLPAGYVSQLRLILGENNSVTLMDSVTTFQLQTPSAQQSGLKININAEIEANTQYELIIDFDANKSVVVTGNEHYLLKPVIKVDTLIEI